MRIFLDTNILLDVFLKRAGTPASTYVLQHCVEPGNEGWIAWHTISNGFYIVRRETKSLQKAQRFVEELLAWADVARTGTAEAQRAQRLKMDDIEDAMQIAAAETCRADYLITRNVNDFATSPIPVFTPEAFLAQLAPPLP